MNTPPKVLLSAGMIQNGFSGVGRYVIEIANRIAQMDSIDLYVAGLESDRYLFSKIKDEKWVEIPDQYSKGIKNLIWHQMMLPGILKRKECDLLHIPSYRRILAKSPIPQLATIHDCAPFRLRGKYGFWRGLFGRKVVPYLAGKCQHIITVSEFTKNDISKFFKIKRDSIEVIYNGLDHSAYHPCKLKDIEQFRLNNGLNKPFFLYVSRLEHPGKNHLRLIEAFERFRHDSKSEIQLILGGAEWHGADVIKKRVYVSPYSNDILLPGFIDEFKLPLWYASAFALVFPSLIEGFGLPVVEALACGLCVLSSDRGSLPEVGGDVAVYFDPENVDSIYNAMMDRYNESSEDHQRRLEKGFEHIKQFNWDNAAKQICETYINLLL